jgi:hypothetical protein
LFDVKFEVTGAVQESRFGVEVYDMKAKEGGDGE